MKNVRDRIHKRVENHFIKLFFIQTENIVNIINFYVLSFWNDIFYLIKNFWTFYIENSFFFYEDSFFFFFSFSSYQISDVFDL